LVNHGNLSRLGESADQLRGWVDDRLCHNLTNCRWSGPRNRARPGLVRDFTWGWHFWQPRQR